MTDCVIDVLPSYVLGVLDPTDHRIVQNHLDQCADCARELRAVSDSLALLADDLSPIAPAPTVRSSVLDLVQSSGRFDDFADAVASLYDVSPDRARDLLAYLESGSQWAPGPGRGVSLVLVQPEGSYAAHTGTFVRVASGATFPWHEHVGDEELLVLQGACLEADGTMFRRGDRHVNAAGSLHSFVAPADGPDFIAAVRVAGGIRFVPPPEVTA